MSARSAQDVSTVEVGPHAVARRVIVQAPANEVFELVDNPHRHHDLDGSGTVRDAMVTGPEQLAVGDTFSIGMKQLGVRYRITSTVTQREEGRLLEWQHPMGHRWRWQLDEIEPGRTQVTETFDYSTAKSPRMLEIGRFPQKNARGMSKTLTALAARFA